MSQTTDTLLRVVDLIGERVDAVKPAQLDAPTPCTEWTVRDLLGHVIGGGKYLSGELSGRSAAIDMSAPPATWTTADPQQAFAATGEGLRAALADPSHATRIVNMPFGSMPAEMAMGIITYDVLAHTWDLSRAIGYDERLPDDLVVAALDALTPLDEMLRAPGVMGPKLDPPAGADAQTRYLCFLGRKP